MSQLVKLLREEKPSHVAMVRFLATRHALPDQRPGAGFPAGQEGSQPPLYYGLAAALWPSMSSLATK